MKNLVLTLLAGFLMTGCGSSGGGNGAAQAQTPTASTQTIDAVTGFLRTQFEVSELDGVASVSCPIDAIAISAGCACQIPDTGPIFGLSIAGNSAVCGCIPVDLDPTDDPVTVNVVCATILTNKAVSSVTINAKPEIGQDFPQISPEEQEAIWAEEVNREEEKLHQLRALQMLK